MLWNHGDRAHPDGQQGSRPAPGVSRCLWWEGKGQPRAACDLGPFRVGVSARNSRKVRKRPRFSQHSGAGAHITLSPALAWTQLSTWRFGVTLHAKPGVNVPERTRGAAGSQQPLLTAASQGPSWTSESVPAVPRATVQQSTGRSRPTSAGGLSLPRSSAASGLEGGCRESCILLGEPGWAWGAPRPGSWSCDRCVSAGHHPQDPGRTGGGAPVGSGPPLGPGVQCGAEGTQKNVSPALPGRVCEV